MPVDLVAFTTFPQSSNDILCWFVDWIVGDWWLHKRILRALVVWNRFAEFFYISALVFIRFVFVVFKLCMFANY